MIKLRVLWASGPVFFTELHRLEIVNAIRRNLAAKRIRRSQALKALRTLRPGKFMSFDDRQGQTAKAEGLAVLP